MKGFTNIQRIKARQYLKSVFGVATIRDLDPVTAHSIIENCEDPDAVNEDGTLNYYCDFIIKEEYLKLHKLNPKMSADKFYNTRLYQKYSESLRAA